MSVSSSVGAWKGGPWCPSSRLLAFLAPRHLLVLSWDLWLPRCAQPDATLLSLHAHHLQPASQTEGAHLPVMSIPMRVSHT